MVLRRTQRVGKDAARDLEVLVAHVLAQHRQQRLDRHGPAGAQLERAAVLRFGPGLVAEVVEQLAEAHVQFGGFRQRGDARPERLARLRQFRLLELRSAEPEVHRLQPRQPRETAPPDGLGHLLVPRGREGVRVRLVGPGLVWRELQGPLERGHRHVEPASGGQGLPVVVPGHGIVRGQAQAQVPVDQRLLGATAREQHEREIRLRIAVVGILLDYHAQQLDRSLALLLLPGHGRQSAVGFHTVLRVVHQVRKHHARLLERAAAHVREGLGEAPRRVVCLHRLFSLHALAPPPGSSPSRAPSRRSSTPMLQRLPNSTGAREGR